MFSMIKDVIRFVPELAPLAAGDLAAQPDDQAKEGNEVAEPGVFGFGEPELNKYNGTDTI
jgi:hypothetical protein